MSNYLLHIKTFLCLSVLAFFLSANLSQNFSGEIKKERTTSRKEQKERNRPEAEFSPVSFNAIVPVIKWEPPCLFFQLTEKPLLEIKVNKFFYLTSFSLSRYFENLFTCIMQINAP